MRYFKIILSLLLISLASCAQQNKNKESKVVTQKLNLHELLEGDPYLKKLQKFDYEPEYQLEVETLYAYDIRVNDMPVASQRPPIGQTLYFPINSSILKSGLQKISFNIYPRFINKVKRESREFLENPENINFKIFIRQTSWIKGSREEPKEVFRYELSEDKTNGKLTAKKQLYKEFTFYAKVPYELEGWTKSKVFNPKDSVKLTKQVFEVYERYRQLMESRNGVGIVKMSQKSMYELSQVTYSKRDEVLKDRKDYLEKFSKEDFLMAPIKDYKLIFYGDNRVLGLVFDDKIEKGKSCINQITVDKDDDMSFSYIKLLLHKPQGSDTLERIR